MSGSLTYLTLPVADLPAATRFYTEVFKWTLERELPLAVFFQTSAFTLALMDQTAFVEFTNQKSVDAGSLSAMCSWNVSSKAEVDRLMARAIKAGATVRRDPALLSWGGRAGIFSTPDGHLWEIVWNPRNTIARSENNL